MDTIGHTTPRRRASAMSKRVLKAVSIFGGLQVFTIICSIVRTKVVAVLIGPAGVGLLALYNSTMEMLQTNSQLNLRQSAVRDIAAASPSQRPALIAATRRWALWLGLIGMALVAICSPLLSRLTFGDGDHTIAFVALAVTMLLAAVTSGRLAELQALDKLSALAKASLWGAVAATVIALPLFYYLRLDAIIPVIITFTACSFAAAMVMRYRGAVPALTRQRAISLGAPMLKLGAYLTVSSGAALIGSYAFVVFLNRHASTDTLGIYQAGYTLVNTYVGVIFTSIAMEYYPRLSATIASARRAAVLVRHEIVTLLWLLMPVIALFVAFDDVAVRLLYAESFMPLLPYVTIAIGGVLFRSVSWCLAFVILARGDGRIYVCTEVASAVITLTLNIGGYMLWGFAGLGVAYVVDFALYTLITYAVYRRRYGMRLSRSIAVLLLLGIGVAALSIVAKQLCGAWLTLLLTLPWLVPLAWRHIMRRCRAPRA
ncbi:MAG: oligosaccharide flippase family protein [Muribaculaceae bacterium]